MDTKSVHGKEYVERVTGQPCKEFRSGDQTTTLMRTSEGKVVEIQHNVMNPQPYNRLFKLSGTKGYATKYPEERFALNADQLKESGVAPQMDNLSAHGFLPAAEAKALMKKYESPIIKKYGELGRKLGHGGMDYMMDARMVYCLQNGLPLDMDVYDLAEWCSLAELSALSLRPQQRSGGIPRFHTRSLERSERLQARLQHHQRKCSRSRCQGFDRGSSSCRQEVQALGSL